MIAFIIYLIAGNAEVNRGPFDLPEAESELTAGYQYRIFRYALRPVLCGRICKLVYHRRSSHNHLPGRMDAATYSWADGFNAIMDYIPGFIWFFGKSFFVVWLLMWIKWTFPRLRIDQILTLEWKYLVPIGLCNLLLMVIIVVFKLHF